MARRKRIYTDLGALQATLCLVGGGVSVSEPARMAQNSVHHLHLSHGALPPTKTFTGMLAARLKGGGLSAAARILNACAPRA